MLFDIIKYTLLFFHVIACILLILLVLMQKPRSEGLGAAFGGSMTDSLWGAQTSDVLIKGTVILAGFFFLVTITLASMETHRNHMVSEGERLRESLSATNAVSTNEPTATNAVMPVSTNQPAATTTPATPAVTNDAPASTKKPEEPSKKK